MKFMVDGESPLTFKLNREVSVRVIMEPPPPVNVCAELWRMLLNKKKKIKCKFFM